MATHFTYRNKPADQHVGALPTMRVHNTWAEASASVTHAVAIGTAFRNGKLQVASADETLLSARAAADKTFNDALADAGYDFASSLGGFVSDEHSAITAAYNPAFSMSLAQSKLRFQDWKAEIIGGKSNGNVGIRYWHLQNFENFYCIHSAAPFYLKYISLMVFPNRVAAELVWNELSEIFSNLTIYDIPVVGSFYKAYQHFSRGEYFRGAYYVFWGTVELKAIKFIAAKAIAMAPAKAVFYGKAKAAAVTIKAKGLVGAKAKGVVGYGSSLKAKILMKTSNPAIHASMNLAGKIFNDTVTVAAKLPHVYRGVAYAHNVVYKRANDILKICDAFNMGYHLTAGVKAFNAPSLPPTGRTGLAFNVFKRLFYRRSVLQENFKTSYDNHMLIFKFN